jgi:RES domain-containing protein
MRDGALAEISFHWSQLDPIPRKPVAIHQIKVVTQKTIHLREHHLHLLGIDLNKPGAIPYPPTQAIGAAAAFLGFDGLLVPSIRWNAENLILFTENSSLETAIEVVDVEHVEWQKWARNNDFLA